jgi:superfamily II DNA/RNA helicase
MGGHPVRDDIAAIRNGCQFLVGTPGRIYDLCHRGILRRDHIRVLILDEADQMLKLGFKEDIERILQTVRKQCGKDLQICLFSATIPSWVRDVASEHMKRDLVYVDLA